MRCDWLLTGSQRNLKGTNRPLQNSEVTKKQRNSLNGTRMKPQRGKTPKKPPRKARRETDPVQVYCRVRPLGNRNDVSCLNVVDPTTVHLVPPETSHAYRTGAGKEYNMEVKYKFQYVFDEYTTQKALFDHVALPLAEDVLNGKNALLFAYGITSSGKTHTMTGSPQDQGVLPRCLDVMFNSIKELQATKYVFRPDRMNGFDVQSEADAMLERQRREVLPSSYPPKTPGRMGDSERIDWNKVHRVRDPSAVSDVEEDNNYAIFISYVEIYNNYIFDLLEDLPYDPITGYKAPQSKTLREDNTHNMYVANVTEVEVKSTEEAYTLLLQGQSRRRCAHTALNSESSRSHSVFNIRLVQGPLDPVGEAVLLDKDKICISQLSLVDLAGSERTDRTKNVGDRLREAGNINQSLMVLRTCIEILRENQQSNGNKMVPYRDSRLTHLFKNYFDGEGKVRMIVCVNPKSEEYDETVQVMRFSEMTQEVQVARPQQIRFDTGLTPGRRKRNLEYKTALENGEDVPIPPSLIYSLGPDFPNLQMQSPHDENILDTLGGFLKSRALRRATLLSDLGTKQETFRNRLLNIDRENLSLKRKNDELLSTLAEKDAENTRLAKRLRSLEKSHETLAKTNIMYEQERSELEREIDTREWKIMQEKSEKDRLRQDYHAKLTLTEQQYNRHLDLEKRKMKENAHNQIRLKQQKLDLLRNIINTDGSDMESTTSSTPSSVAAVRSTAASRARWNQSQAARNLAKSTPDLSNSGLPERTRANTVSASSATTPRYSHHRTNTYAPSSTPSRTGPPVKPKPATRSTASRPKTPPPLKPKPTMSTRRRSKSAHDIWLDHRPERIVETGNVLQPQMKKRRSVTQLKEKDTKVASKYALTTQQIDSEGEIATKIVKGDIHKTVGGGTSVLFTDVETLRKSEPADRNKRHPHISPADFDGEWSDAEDRCRIAVEGHGHLKKCPETPKSAVSST